MSFTLQKLTEGIRQRHMGAQHQRLTEKWNRTGLLRGLNGQNKENMAVLLENQAAVQEVRPNAHDRRSIDRYCTASNGMRIRQKFIVY